MVLRMKSISKIEKHQKTGVPLECFVRRMKRAGATCPECRKKRRAKLIYAGLVPFICNRRNETRYVQYRAHRHLLFQGKDVTKRKRVVTDKQRPWLRIYIF